MDVLVVTGGLIQGFDNFTGRALTGRAERLGDFLNAAVGPAVKTILGILDEGRIIRPIEYWGVERQRPHT
ncbi:MAG: hypothetical protein K1X42_17195 [Opitutaceae bacterium]|nr:hypothetical protein [Opitutaceae bacterium]